MGNVSLDNSLQTKKIRRSRGFNAIANHKITLLATETNFFLENFILSDIANILTTFRFRLYTSD